MATLDALKRAFSARMLQTFGLKPPNRLAISVSGGVDSMALASMTSDWAQSRNVELHAFIVNHNLRENSRQEAIDVSEALRHKFNMNANVLNLKFGFHASRLEEFARAGRRSTLENACLKAGITNVLMGHHLNDQAELFIQRFLSGSSWFGLAGMATKTLLKPLVVPEGPPPITIVRPLLQFQKQDLRYWCEHTNTPWWEDPTNEDINLTKRNLIRRMYKEGAEPPQFSMSHLEDLINFLGKQRAKAERMAHLAYQQLQASERILYHEGMAELQLSDDIRALPLMVRMELLFRILAPISPYNEDKLFTRRHRLRNLAEDLTRRGRQLQTALGVKVTGTSTRWTFYRETARKSEQSQIEVFQARAKWSPWTLIDNRWWMRWKLPYRETTPKFFNIRMLAKPDPVLDPIASTTPPEILLKLRRVSVSHPFLMWSDSTDPHAFENTKFIGFPTLKLYRGLDFQIQPKTYEFIPQY